MFDEFEDIEYEENEEVEEGVNEEEVADLPEDEEDDEIEDDEEEVEEDETEEDEEVEEVEESPKQDEKTNKAFATMRKQIKELEQRLEHENMEKDRWVQDLFGKQYGINTFEEYKEVMEKQVREQKEREWEEQGYDAKVIREIMKSDPLYQQQQMEMQKNAENEMLAKDFSELQNKYPSLIQKPEDIDKDTWLLVDRGYRLKDAFVVTNQDKIINAARDVTKQKTLNKINGKSHIKNDGGNGNVEDVAIPPDTLKMYKMLNPNMSMAQIKKHYARSLKER